MKGRVLIVAGSDSGGGAGIQADIKTVTALGGYAATAITAITVQDTRAVYAVHRVPPKIVAGQMEAVIDDIGVDAIKIGMLHKADVIEAVADVLDAKAAGIPIVVDPVMVTTSGASLLTRAAVRVLKARILVRAAVLKPNVIEAAALTGLEIKTLDDMIHAAEMLTSLGPEMTLVTGGDLDGDRVYDVLATNDEIDVSTSERVATTSIHGTGCTMTSAIATGLAQGMGPRDAITRARAFVYGALKAAPGLGHGHGPLDHTHAIAPFPPSREHQ